MSQVSFSEFKAKLIASDSAFRSFTDKELLSMYEGKHILSLIPSTASASVTKHAASQAATESYHLWLEEQVKGPFTMGQLRAMWISCQITSETLYTMNAEPDWRPLADIVQQLEADTLPAKGQIHATTVDKAIAEQPKRNAGAVVFILLLVVGAIIGLIMLVSISQKNAAQSKQDNLNQLQANLEDHEEKLNEAAIADHMVRAGMSKEDVLRSLGHPDNRIDTAGQNPHLKEIWQYDGNKSLGFDWNDQVVAPSDNIDFDKSDAGKAMISDTSYMTSGLH